MIAYVNHTLGSKVDRTPNSNWHFDSVSLSGPASPARPPPSGHPAGTQRLPPGPLTNAVAGSSLGLDPLRPRPICSQGEVTSLLTLSLLLDRKVPSPWRLLDAPNSFSGDHELSRRGLRSPLTKIAASQYPSMTSSPFSSDRWAFDRCVSLIDRDSGSPACDCPLSLVVCLSSPFVVCVPRIQLEYGSEDPDIRQGRKYEHT